MRESRALRIVLICGNIIRDYAGIKYLKNKLSSIQNVHVSIIGSGAEIERIFYLLARIKPHIVFIPQVQEHSCRDIATYVKKSGGILCVLPLELTYSTSYADESFNKRITFNKFVDYYFLPGPQMKKDILKYTDISVHKLFVTGNPKTDILLNKTPSLNDLGRVTKVNQLRKNKKTIGIFTSFIVTPVEYVKKEIGYKGMVQSVRKRDGVVLQTKKTFIDGIQTLCRHFPNIQFMLKIHPQENFHDYDVLQSPNLIKIHYKQLLPLLPLIDMGIHFNSTASTECWIKNIPTIQYAPNPKILKYLSDYQYGNPVVTKSTDLYAYIEKYLSSKMETKYRHVQAHFLRSWYYKIDGKSSDRIVRIIRRIIKKELPHIKLKYRERTGLSCKLFMISEKIFGIFISRRLAGIIRKDFAWKYAIDNYVNE